MLTMGGAAHEAASCPWQNAPGAKKGMVATGSTEVVYGNGEASRGQVTRGVR